MAGQITALWQEAEAHLREFERLARRTVEAAWLAGDALMRIKEQLPHGSLDTALHPVEEAVSANQPKLAGLTV